MFESFLSPPPLLPCESVMPLSEASMDRYGQGPVPGLDFPAMERSATACLQLGAGLPG